MGKDEYIQQRMEMRYQLMSLINSWPADPKKPHLSGLHYLFENLRIFRIYCPNTCSCLANPAIARRINKQKTHKQHAEAMHQLVVQSQWGYLYVLNRLRTFRIQYPEIWSPMANPAIARQLEKKINIAKLTI